MKTLTPCEGLGLGLVVETTEVGFLLCTLLLTNLIGKADLVTLEAAMSEVDVVQGLVNVIYGDFLTALEPTQHIIHGCEVVLVGFGERLILWR
jgi:hypothetical protein